MQKFQFYCQNINENDLNEKNSSPERTMKALSSLALLNVIIELEFKSSSNTVLDKKVYKIDLEGISTSTHTILTKSTKDEKQVLTRYSIENAIDEV